MTEEAARPFDPNRRYTFTIDPIDGTDVYSQGMTGWCVSVGLQDRNLRPMAGIVYAPRLDLLFFSDVGRAATLNGASIHVPDRAEPLSAKSNVMIPSRSHHWIDLRAFPGKVDLGHRLYFSGDILTSPLTRVIISTVTAGEDFWELEAA